MLTIENALVEAMRKHHKPAPASERLVLEVLDSHRTIGTTINRELRGKAKHYSIGYERNVRERLETLEKLGLVRKSSTCCTTGGVHWETVEG
jgi:repressor of nif and glnA expression